MFEALIEGIAKSGYAGIAGLMLAEHLFPPIPSELIMPLAGYLSARGDLNFGLSILVGSIGSLAGCSFWYAAARMLGKERVRRLADKHGRWLTMAPTDLDRAADNFRRHRALSVSLGRLMSGLRTFISIPAGLAGMPLLPFFVFSAIGTFVWTSVLVTAGYLLQEQFRRFTASIDMMSKIVVGLLLAGYLYRVITFNAK